MFNLKNSLILLFFIILTTIASQSSYFSTENIQVGDVADKAIYSPKTHRYLDEDATEKMKEEAVTNVQAVYNEDSTILSNIESDLTVFVESITTFKEKKSNTESNLVELSKDKNFNLENEVNTLKSEIKNPFSFSNAELDLFINLSNDNLARLKDVLLEEMQLTYSNRVTHDIVEKTKQSFIEKNTLLFFFDKEKSNVLSERFALRIVPNFTLDEAETLNRQIIAAESVDAVYKEIKKGEVIIRVGEIVSEEQYNKLVQLGLASESFKVSTMLSKLPYFALVFFAVLSYISYFYEKDFRSIKQFIFLLSALSLTTILTDIIVDSYFKTIPVLTMLMIFATFWGRRFLMFSSIIIGLLISNGDFYLLAISLLGGIVLTVAFHSIEKRMNIIIAGLSLGLILSISEVIIFYAFDMKFDFSSSFGLLVCGVVASVLTIGLIPVVENILGRVTPLKLYELSDPNHPLLKRLLTEALGTYTHSLMVANLAELAAEKIGANGMLLRVAAYFHDVGKLKNPEYFIENSTPDNNPHKFIDEITSASIIREHPIDSIRICKEYKLPQAILDLIECHHGDAVLYHLYNPAKEKDPTVSIKDFKYLTPKPKTKEEGILLLADSVEAYSRVLKNESSDVIAEKVREMIFKKVEHGVLSDCDLSLKELDDITEAFVHLLSNSNHERIPYAK